MLRSLTAVTSPYFLVMWSSVTPAIVRFSSPPSLGRCKGVLSRDREWPECLGGYLPARCAAIRGVTAGATGNGPWASGRVGRPDSLQHLKGRWAARVEITDGPHGGQVSDTLREQM